MTPSGGEAKYLSDHPRSFEDPEGEIGSVCNLSLDDLHGHQEARYNSLRFLGGWGGGGM